MGFYYCYDGWPEANVLGGQTLAIACASNYFGTHKVLSLLTTTYLIVFKRLRRYLRQLVECTPFPMCLMERRKFGELAA